MESADDTVIGKKTLFLSSMCSEPIEQRDIDQIITLPIIYAPFQSMTYSSSIHIIKNLNEIPGN